MNPDQYAAADALLNESTSDNEGVPASGIEVSSEGASGETTTTESGASGKSEGSEQPAPTPEQIKAELAEERRKFDNQLQVNKRQKAALEKREAELAKREKAIRDREIEIDSVGDAQSFVEFAAKRRGVPHEEILKEWAEVFNNGGKPSEATVAKRERDQLKREREEFNRENERKANEERERAQASELQSWGDQVDATLGVENGAFGAEATAKWPRLTSQAAPLVQTTIVHYTNEYIKETGTLPDHIQLLDWIESQIPEPVKPSPGAVLGKKKTAASTPVTTTGGGTPAKRKLETEQERREAAIDFLNRLPSDDDDDV